MTIMIMHDGDVDTIADVHTEFGGEYDVLKLFLIVGQQHEKHRCH